MRLKELREEKNLSQNDLAKEINTSQRNIGRWENGTNEPTAGFVVALANYFQCSIDYLLGRTDDFGNVTVQTNGVELTKNEETLLRYYRALSNTEQAQVAEYTAFLAEKHGK